MARKTTKLLKMTAAVALAVAAGGSLSSCTSDDDSLMPTPSDPTEITSGDEISYNVVAEGSTRPASGPSRAMAVYNSNNLPDQFYISVWNKDTVSDMGHLFIAQDLIKDTNPKGGHNWVDQSGVRYWPKGNDKLDFFASNSSLASLTEVEKLNPSYNIPFTVQGDAADQTDLIYATAYNQSRTATGTATGTSQKVNLDFHHALAQVVFTAQCSNPNIEVLVTNVSIVGPAATGTFKVPVLNQNEPAWQIAANYTPSTLSASTVYDDGAVKVYNGKADLTAGTSQTDRALMLLPQTLAAADPTQANPWSGQKAYLKVDCEVWNVADPGKGLNENTDHMLFGIQDGIMYNTDTLYIPISVNWQAGHRYVYNLMFGQGGGGYTADGHLALIPVKYGITVDNWVEAGIGNVAEPG